MAPALAEMTGIALALVLAAPAHAAVSRTDPAQIRAAAEAYVAGEFASLGYEVARQTYLAQGVESTNLEVTVPGGARASEIVLAGAHYDTVPGSPGADDNASGVRYLSGSSAGAPALVVARCPACVDVILMGDPAAPASASAVRKSTSRAL